MAEPTPTTGQTPTPPPPRRRSWVRRLLLVALVLVLGLVVLVALAPTLLGTRPAVNIALGQVNKRLNGHVEVASVSLGWTTGVRLDGLRVFDLAGAQIAQVDHVVCPMPLWRAATGKYPLGDTVVDGLAFDAKVDGQGRLNFAELAKKSPSGTKPAESNPAAPAKPSKLPDVSGDIKLTNARGTVSQPGKPTVYLTKLAGEVKIPGINDPITDHLDASVRVGDAGPEGHLVADGTAAAIKGNAVDLDTADVHQTADLDDLDLAAAKPFAPASLGLDTLSGLLAGHLGLDVTGGKSAVVDALLTAKQKVMIGGKVLSGDTYSTDTFAVAVPKLSAAFPDGLGHWQSGRVTVGAAPGSPPVSFKVDQASLTLVADVVPQALLNLKANAAPGSAGKIEITQHLDAGQLIAQLKHTSHTSRGVTVTGGTLDQHVVVVLTPDRATLNGTLDLTGVAGTRAVAGAAPQPIAVQPVHLALSGSDLGGGGALPDLRELSLKLASKFANADFHGTTIGDLTGTLTAQLQALQNDAGQFVDLSGTTLAGDVNVAVANHGQLLQAPHRAAVKATATIHDLRYAAAGGTRVDEPFVRADLVAGLQGSEQRVVESANNVALTLKAGDEAAPTVDLAAEVPAVALGGELSADYKLTRCDVDLAQAQRQFAAVTPGRGGLVVPRGTLTATAAGHYTKDAVTFDGLTLAVAHLYLAKQLPDGQKVNAVADDTINVAASGSTTLGAAKTVHLTALSVADSAKILDVHKGTGDVTVVKDANGFGGSGQVAVAVELGSVDTIVQHLGRTTAGAPAVASGVKSGRLVGTLALDAASATNTAVNGAFDITNLIVTTATGDAPAETAHITVKATADRTAGTVNADEVSFKSGFANATLTNATLALNAKSTLDKLQKLALQVDVPDLKVLAALAQSFSAPAPAPAAGAAAPTPPLQVTAGSFSMHADVAHVGNNLTVSVPSLAANDVAFKRGTASYAAKPVTAKLAARVGTADGPTLMKQLRDLQVTQLDATSGVGTVSLTTPITVTDLSNPAASAAGGIKVDGELADLTQLAAAFEAKPADAYPYRGHYTLTEDLTGGQAVAAKGGIQVAKFQVMQGQAVQFAEDQLSVTNDVSMAADLNSVTLHALAVAMQSSGALNVSVADGTVTDLAHARQLHLPVQLQYDLAKLWPVVHPMLVTAGQPDKYKDVKISGAFKKSLLIDGSYPAGVPATEAIKPLKVDADLAVGSFEDNGLVVKDLDVPVTLRDGKAVTAKPDGTTAPVATANDGQLDLGNLTIDLTQTPYRLTTPANKAVLAHATINPLFSQTFLAKVVNNPIFAGAQQATGLLDFTVDSCTQLPLGNLVTEAVPANTGTADVRFSLTNLHIGLQGLGQLSSALNQDSFEAHIDNGTVAIARGVSTQHVKFVTGTYSLGFDGTVRLADEAFTPMTVSVPMVPILQKTGLRDPNVLKYVPDQVGVPLRGTVHKPELSLGEAIANAARDAAIKGGVGSLLGGNKGGGGQPNPADAIGGLLKGFGKKK